MSNLSAKQYQKALFRRDRREQKARNMLDEKAMANIVVNYYR